MKIPTKLCLENAVEMANTNPVSHKRRKGTSPSAILVFAFWVRQSDEDYLSSECFWNLKISFS